MSDVKIKLAAATHQGLVRDNNEDNFVVNPDLSSSHWVLPVAEDAVDLGPYGALVVVADGMGGANAGEVASALAVESVQQMFEPARLERVLADKPEETPSKVIEDFMKEAVETADMAIVQRMKEDSSTEGMGTTIVLLWILGKRANVAWCGDSRCYVFNPAAGLVQLSKDHSYVQELVDEGKLEPENMFDHPYNNIITRCLGDSENRAKADFRSVEFRKGDLFLLCSDGLFDMCRDSEILNCLLEGAEENGEVCRFRNLRDYVALLIESALDAGGADNVTVALCQVEGNIQPEEGSSMAATVPFKNLKKRKVWMGLVGLMVLAGLASVLLPCYFPQWQRLIEPALISSDSLWMDSVAVDSLNVDSLSSDGLPLKSKRK